ncbi:MAG: hypothetical protein II821_04540 [Treponema sp.]|nr:hypothetical protein [Treponema sp.]
MITENMIIHSPSDFSPFLVVFKPAGLPSAPLFEGDESILTEAIKLFPEISLVHGKKEVEHGLVHRIDTETQGLVLIATTQKSYDNLIQSQKDGKFEKWYRAEFDRIPDCPERLGGFPNLPEEIFRNISGFSKNKSQNDIVVESFFRAFGEKGREVRPVTENAGRAALKKSGSVLYKTEISLKNENTAVCHITAGYRHQVRCHLAWCGFPVKGDKVYNPENRGKSEKTEVVAVDKMKFTASRIDFPHPLSGEVLSFSLQDLQM